MTEKQHGLVASQSTIWLHWVSSNEASETTLDRDRNIGFMNNAYPDIVMHWDVISIFIHLTDLLLIIKGIRLEDWKQRLHLFPPGDPAM